MSVSTNLGLQDKIDLPKTTLRSLKAEDMWGAISAARFLLVGTEVYLVVPNSTLCPDGALIYGSVMMKGLQYTQYEENMGYFSYPGWVGLNTYTKIITEFPSFKYFNG